MISLIGFHNLADVIFGITYKSLYIHHQAWSGNTLVLNKQGGS